jgi:hypothetical protein
MTSRKGIAPSSLVRAICGAAPAGERERYFSDKLTNRYAPARLKGE